MVQARVTDGVRACWQMIGCIGQRAGQHCSRVQVQGFRALIQAEGYQALLHGMSARVAFHIPAAAVCWGTYESMKSMLSR